MRNFRAIVVLGVGVAAAALFAGAAGASARSATGRGSSAAAAAVPVTAVATTAPMPVLDGTTPADPTGTSGAAGSSGAGGITSAPPTTLGPIPERPLKNSWGPGLTPMPGSLVLDMDDDPTAAAAPEKWVALTFDDGPSKYTKPVLEILNREKVGATFFMLSENVLERPDDAKAVAASGYSVAAHTVTHRDLATLTDDERFTEINQSVDDINKTVGAGTVKCLRPPYGSFNTAVLQVSADRGIGVVNWDIDTEDWKVRDADRIFQRAAGAYQKSIILMHDGGGNRDATVAALPRIIADLKAKGYKFVQLC